MISASLHYAFHLSAYFLKSPFPGLPVLHPDHDIMMQRQSERVYRYIYEYSTYPMTTAPGLQGLMKQAGIRDFSSLPPAIR